MLLVSFIFLLELPDKLKHVDDMAVIPQFHFHPVLLIEENHLVEFKVKEWRGYHFFHWNDTAIVWQNHGNAMGWGGVIEQFISEMCQTCNHFDIYF